MPRQKSRRATTYSTNVQMLFLLLTSAMLGLTFMAKEGKSDAPMLKIKK
jgi:hypothetical protein